MTSSIYICAECGAEHRKWMGQCPDCREWNTISEQLVAATIPASKKASPLATRPITQVEGRQSGRSSTRIEELDRVLGGGLVPGSAILIGGDPGIGKSTLLLQAAEKLAADGPVLYITGEESPEQVKLRGERIDAMHQNVHIAAGTDVDAALHTIHAIKPIAVIIDSVQTMVSSRLSSAPGTVSQVRETAASLIQNAKQHGHALLLVGHVTKDGSIAGPRVLEHMVDAVIYFEGDRGHQYRILRAVKNRFGPAGEIGVFEMHDKGLLGITDASRLFLAERASHTPGSVVLACMEGTRPLLVEIQALVAPTVYATPRRAAIGLDSGRVAMLTAVLERRVGLHLSDQDVYINVAGGVRLTEPAADLAVLLAMISACQDKALPNDLAVFGEVGLTGEVRPVGQPEARAREAASLGFARLLMPKENHERVRELKASATMPPDQRSMPRCIPVRNLAEAAQAGLA